MSLPSFSVRRRVLVAMFFLCIAVLGLVSFTKLSLDMFPDVEPPVISVITPWLGASATDVEQKVTKVLEDQLSALPDLDDMSSISQDNMSIIQLKFNWGTNLDEASNNIRSLNSFARRFLPEEVEETMLFRLNLAQLPILMLAVTSEKGDIQEHSKLVEDRVADELSRVDGVASLVVFNQRSKQLRVSVDRRRLDVYGLSMQQVAGTLQASNLTLPAGTMDLGRSSYTIRAPGEFETVADVKNVIVGQSKTTGALVYLKDIAEVDFSLEDKVSVSSVNGKPAMVLMAQRESGANTVDVATALTDRIHELNHELPAGMQISIIMDLSDNIVMMIDALTEAVYWGGLLVILVVLFFLRRWRSGLIVALSIPLSLIGVFAMLAAGGFTLNMISIAAMAIAVGMVVDDSIVVLDNIVHHVEGGRDPTEAAPLGASEVSNAVTAATATTASIFLPVLFVGGLIGIMFKELAFVIIVAIALSLLVSLMLVPVLSHRLLKAPGAEKKRRFLSGKWRERLLTKMERAYGKLIAAALGHRKKVVGIAMGLFAASFLITAVVGVDFIPKTDGGSIQIKAELPIGTNVDYTLEIADEIRDILIENIPEAQEVFVMAGSSRSGLGSVMGGRQGPNIATIGCRVPKRSQRDRSTFEMAEAIRPEIEAIPGLVSVEIEGSNPLTKLASGGDKPFIIELFADDISALRGAASEVRRIVEATPGAVDTVTDLMDDSPELRLNIDRLRAARLGVPVASVSAAVRMSMYGSAVTRFRGGDEDVDLFLRLRDDQRKQVSDLENLTVPSLTGEQIRLSSLASVTEAESPLEIRRLDQKRVLRVLSNVTGRPLGDIAIDVEEAIAEAQKAGRIDQKIAMRFAGDVKEQRAMMVDLSLALLLAVLLVYMVMAAQFESLLDPLIVMFSVPFGITGVLLALPATGITLSLTAFIGAIMLVGIVVKNAIVLVDYINLMRDRGLALEEAVIKGGERRLRPVLMTAFTTIGGMLPLALTTGEGHEMWRPMAVAVIGGLLVSTLVTLVLIPTLYALTDRWRKRGRAATGAVDQVSKTTRAASGAR